MQRLGNALQRFPRLRAVQDPNDPEYVERFLLPLPPTAAVQAGRDQCAARLAEVPADAPISNRRAAEALAWAEKQLARCAERDALQTTRPDGCWCLGLGGRDRVATRYFRPDGAPIERWRTYCGCAAGRAAEAQHSGDVEATEAAMVQARLERLLGELPHEYRGWTLHTLAEQSAAHRALADQVQAWLDTDRWLFLHGPVGRGKTGAAVGALLALSARGKAGAFQDVAGWLWRLRTGYAAGGAEAFAKERSAADDARWTALMTAPVLLLDDLGAEYHKPTPDGGPDWATEQIWLLVGERHREGRRTILTSNHDTTELADRFNHSRIPSRIQERALSIDVSPLPYLRKTRSAAA